MGAAFKWAVKINETYGKKITLGVKENQAFSFENDTVASFFRRLRVRLFSRFFIIFFYIFG